MQLSEASENMYEHIDQWNEAIHLSRKGFMQKKDDIHTLTIGREEVEVKDVIIKMI